jgi:hypothetical protein
MNLSKRSQQIHSIPTFVGRREKPTDLSGDYIVGLTDGEGCFYVETRAPVGAYKSPRVEMHFFIKLREDDLPLLKAVQHFFGCGGIYYQKEYRENQRNCYRFGVTSQNDLRTIIIPFFDSHPLKSQKLKNFLLFKEIGEMVRQRVHQNSQGFKKIQQLKFQMNTRARPVRENRSPGGNAKLPKLSQSARQGSKVGGTRMSSDRQKVKPAIRLKS